MVPDVASPLIGVTEQEMVQRRIEESDYDGNDKSIK